MGVWLGQQTGISMSQGTSQAHRFPFNQAHRRPRMNQAKHPEGEGRGPAAGPPSKPCFVSRSLELCSAMWKPLHWDLGQPHLISLPSLFSNSQGSLGDYSLPTKGRTYREVKRNCKCDHCCNPGPLSHTQREMEAVRLSREDLLDTPDWSRNTLPTFL